MPSTFEVFPLASSKVGVHHRGKRRRRKLCLFPACGWFSADASDAEIPYSEQFVVKKHGGEAESPGFPESAFKQRIL